jgi:biopolymer transport protein ExbD
MRTLSRAHAAGESHGIDLAPMLDFVVNLLIFFIITAVFVKQAGIDVSRPSLVTTGKETASKSIVIDDNGEISIDLKPIDLRAVRAHVEQFSDRRWRVLVADRGAPTCRRCRRRQIRLGGITASRSRRAAQEAATDSLTGGSPARIEDSHAGFAGARCVITISGCPGASSSVVRTGDQTNARSSVLARRAATRGRTRHATAGQGEARRRNARTPLSRSMRAVSTATSRVTPSS